MPQALNPLQKRSQKQIYLGSLLATAAVIFSVAIIHHVLFLGDFTPGMLAAPLVVSLITGSLIGTILWLKLRLKEQNHVFKILADSSREFSYVQDMHGDYLYISPSVKTITGYTAAEFSQQTLGMDAIIHMDDKHRWTKHPSSTRAGRHPKPIELRIVSKDGKVRWISHYSQIISHANGEALGIQSSNIDITERKQYEGRILHMADFDPLTDLPNRRHLTRYMLELTDSNQKEPATFAILFMDLNRFKYINDVHGHSFGDRLLQKVANHLKATSQKHSLITRFGGDEFVIVSKNFKSLQELERETDALARQLESPFNIDGHTVNIGASIGIAVYPHDGTTPDTLIKNADAAMFRAKKAGRNYQFFSIEMAEHAESILSLESQLREAIYNDEIKLHFQPLFSIQTGQTIGAEALARWTNASGDQIPPATFIAIAEETGLIIPLSRNLVRQALQQTRTWIGLGLDIRVAINISARQFLDKDFVVNTIQLLEESEVPARHLEIELTESALLEDKETAIQKLQQLQNAGIAIALDDFGTGYSSLSYLSSLPLDTLKIDRSFITGMMKERAHEAICKTIVMLAHELGLKVVAEGIETENQLDKAREIGCDVGQGYLYSRPIPASEITPFLLEKARLATHP
jgi:diguanylate cyclase (GGDEF)-like protein/PAS domain S-box-containing protein